MVGVVRASGQGINHNFIYTGDYDDVPEFGFVTYEQALQLIRSLPPFSKEADDAGLCPPAIMFTDASGNSLVISSSVNPGRYDAYFSGVMEGTSATDATYEEIAELLSRFFSGAPIPVDTSPSKLEEDETLVFIPGEYYDIDEGWVSTPMMFNRRPDGSMYVRVYRDRLEKVEIPLHYVIEVELSKGIRFLSNPCVTVKYVDERGKTSKEMVCMKGDYRSEIPRYAAEISRLLPGRVRIK